MGKIKSVSRRKVQPYKLSKSKQQRGSSYAVLLDFKQAQYGMSGIGQDLRLILYALQNSPIVRQIGLLLYPKFLGNGGFKMHQSDDVALQSNCLYRALDLDNQTSARHSPMLSKLLKTAGKFSAQVMELFTRSSAVTSIDKQYFAGALYRNLFPDHEVTVQQAFKKTKMFVGNFSRQHMLISECLFKRMPFLSKTFRLDTSEYDFFITQFWNTFEISDNTTLIIRAHDAVPVTDFDTVKCEAEYFGPLMRRNSTRAYFVCNSDPVQAKLIKLAPQLVGKIFTVPCAASDLYKQTIDLPRLQSVCTLHWSGTHLKGKTQAHILTIREKIAAQIRSTKPMDYILFVSTIEPRKNLWSLIEAWHPMYTSHGLRLVICGNEGWQSKNVLMQMSHLVEIGAIIHLEKVPLHDMPLLYSHARAFVSPSYAEGFGIPVVEAMRCQCPIAISNIEEYRWVAGNAALYFDPYNVIDIRAQINALLFNKNSEVLRQKLIKAGLAQSERYTVKAVSKAWQETLDKIARQRVARSKSRKL